MNPSDFDDEDGGGLSFNELPPSARQRMAQQQAMPQPVGLPSLQMPQQPMMPAYAAQQQAVYMPQAPAFAAGPQVLPAASPMHPVPVEQYQPPIYQVQPQAQVLAQPKQDSMPWLFILATVALGGIGWWAYRKMEKDRKFRVGPPSLPGGDYTDDGADDEGADADDGESATPLDEYADAGLPEKDVDPHEDGGIKMVRG